MENKPGSLQIFSYFLKLGMTGFGGPLALVSQMQRDLSEQKKWISEDDFRDLFALIKMMPGPLATQMGIFIGYRFAGFLGALSALIGLTFPGFLMMVVLAAFYQELSHISYFNAAFQGMKLASFALIVMALWGILRPYYKNWFFWVMMVLASIAMASGKVLEPVLMVVFGGLSFTLAKRKKTLNSADPVIIFELVKICLYAGAFVFGSGLAIVPFLEADFVQKLGWISRSEFMDALSFGQLTPGPVIMTVTFLGYKVAGLTGATLATAAVFLPCFIHMTTWFPRIFEWLKKQTWLPQLMVGVFAVVVAGIGLALVRLTQGLQWFDFLSIAIVCLLLVKTKIPSWFMILAAGAISMIVTMAI